MAKATAKKVEAPVVAMVLSAEEKAERAKLYREEVVSELFRDYTKAMKSYRERLQGMNVASGVSAQSATAWCYDIFEFAAKARVAEELIRFVWAHEREDAPWSIAELHARLTEAALREASSSTRSTSMCANVAAQEYVAALAARSRELETYVAMESSLKARCVMVGGE